MDELGLNNQKYLELQLAHTQEWTYQLGNRLYLEFGNELFDDHHASWVLPGFEPDGKVRIFKELRDSVKIVIAVCANGIEKNKIQDGLGITYDVGVLRLIDAFRGEDLLMGSAVTIQYAGQPVANVLRRRMEHLGVQACPHYPIVGYPHNADLTVSDGGYGKNDYTETSCSLVVVTTPDPGSGKMATCLSQLYHDYKRGVKAGYAKSETSPIWNLPLQHPVNPVYEATTVDLGDVNMIDPFRLAAYGKAMVNYNRSVEIFPVLSAMFERIMRECPYKLSTDMGANMAGKYIMDDEAVCAATRQEIVRRYHTALCDRRMGAAGDELMNKLELLMQRVHMNLSIRPVVAAAAQVAEETGDSAGVIELPSNGVVTGKTTDLTNAPSVTLLNALKRLAGTDYQHHPVSREVTKPIQAVKTNHLGSVNPRLYSDETPTTLAISATTNPLAKWALGQPFALRGCEAHSTAVLSPMDSGTYSRPGLRLICEPQYETNELYHK